jgi:hypothetical protein
VWRGFPLTNRSLRRFSPVEPHATSDVFVMPVAVPLNRQRIFWVRSAKHNQ